MFFFDCETTGLDHKRHAIVQIAWIIKRGRDVIVKRSFDVAPDDTHDLNLKALEVNGFTLERLNKGIAAPVMISRMAEDVKFAMGGSEGLIPCGHNVKFDLDFLNTYVQKGSEKYFINYGPQSALMLARPVCTLALCHYLNYCGVLKLDNYKLANVCKEFSIPISAHDALSDVEATVALLDKLDMMIAEDVVP